MYTTAQVAQKMHVAESTVIRWIKNGELRALPNNLDPKSKKPRYLVGEFDLAEFQKGRKRGGAATQDRAQEKVPRRSAKSKATKSEYIKYYEE